MEKLDYNVDADIDRLNHISFKYSSEHRNKSEVYMKEIADDLMDDDPCLSLSNLSLGYILSVNEKSIKSLDFNEDSFRDLKTLQFEIAKYIYRSALSNTPEDQSRFKNFFLIQPDIKEEYKEYRWRENTIKATALIVDILAENGIEDPEFNQKLFQEVYLPEAVDEVFKSYNPYDSEEHIKTTQTAIEIFEKSQFYTEENREMFRMGIDRLSQWIFENFDYHWLSNDNYNLSQFFKTVLESEWFLIPGIEKEWLDNEEFINQLVKTDIQARKNEEHGVNFQTPLVVIQDCVEGFKEKATTFRTEKVGDSLYGLMGSLMDIQFSDEDASLLDRDKELKDNIKTLEQYFHKNYSNSLVESLQNLTGLEEETIRGIFYPLFRGLISSSNGYFNMRRNEDYDFQKKAYGSKVRRLGEYLRDYRFDMVADYLRGKFAVTFDKLRYRYLAGEELGDQEIEVLDKRATRKEVFDIDDEAETVGRSIKLKGEDLKAYFDIDKERREELIESYKFLIHLISLCEGRENPVFKLPNLEFDEIKREKAREDIKTLGGVESTGEDRDRIIELVLENGLFEYYTKFPEILDMSLLRKTFNRISFKEKTEKDRVNKRASLDRMYWKNFLYPYFLTHIHNDSIEGLESRLVVLSKGYPNFLSKVSEKNSESRNGLLFDLIQYYKKANPEQKKAIQKFVSHRVADYPIKPVK
jgi:hypothetical protein